MFGNMFTNINIEIMTVEKFSDLLIKKIKQNQEENKCSYWKAVNNISEEIVALNGLTYKSPVIQDENNPQKGYFVNDDGQGTYIANCVYNKNVWMEV